MSITTRKYLCDCCKIPTEQKLHRKVSASGVVLVGWVCSLCNSWVKSKSGGYWISHNLLEQYHIDIDHLPIKKDGGPEDKTMSLF